MGRKCRSPEGNISVFIRSVKFPRRRSGAVKKFRHWEIGGPRPVRRRVKFMAPKDALVPPGPARY